VAETSRKQLIQSRSPQPGVYLEDLCFQAQQAAEKSLKALILSREVAFPYIHDIARLITILESHGEKAPPDVREAARLNDYAVEARYPGLSEPVPQAEYEEAVELAETTVRWAKSRLETPEGT
jgi:HEPN domain-containing protein